MTSTDFQNTIDDLLNVNATLEIVQSLERNELILNELYLNYAEIFPEYESFWKRIASDEKEHAEWVSSLYTQVMNGNLLFKNDRFHKNELDAFYHTVKYSHAKISESKMNIKDASKDAINIENTLIERHFFRVFESDFDILKNVFDKIEKSTEQHYKQVQDLYSDLNK